MDEVTEEMEISLAHKEMIDAQEHSHQAFVAALRAGAAGGGDTISPIPMADRTQGALSVTVTADQRRSVLVGTPTTATSVDAAADQRQSVSVNTPTPGILSWGTAARSTVQQRGQQLQAAEARLTSANLRGMPRGRGRGGVSTSRRVQEIAPTALFSQATTSPQKTVSSVPLSLPTSAHAPRSSLMPEDSLYTLGMRMAQAADISSEEYARQFSVTLTRLVRSNDCEIVFLDGSTPRITSVNSISIQSDSTLLAQCVCQQFRDAPMSFRPMSQLWMISRHELGSALQSVSSIQPLSSLFEEAVAQCSIMYVGKKAPVASTAASTADPLRQFRGESDAGNRSQQDVSSSRFLDDSGRGDRRRQHSDDGDRRRQHPDDGDRRLQHSDEDDSGEPPPHDAYNDRRGYGQRGGVDRAKNDPFKKWDSSKEKTYKGECYLTEDLSDVVSAPARWLSHMANRFTFYAIDKRYWVAGALYAVTPEIKERFIRMCRAADDLLPMPWEGYIEHLARADVDFYGNLPPDHPMSWHVFSIWLNAEFTDLGLGKKQLSFVKNLKQSPEQTTTNFNVIYNLQLERLADLQKILPLEERERFDSATWRENYLRSLLPPISEAVRKRLADLTATLLIQCNEARPGRSFEERMQMKQRINLGYDDKTLEWVMSYAAGLDRLGQISKPVVPSTRPSFLVPRASSTTSSRSSLGSARASSSMSRPPRRFNQLAIMDDPLRQPEVVDAGQAQADSPRSGEEDTDVFLESPEVFFGQMASRHTNIWTREQLGKLRAKNLCFRCGQPNCMARTCKNTPVNPRDFKLNHIRLEHPVHYLPEDDDALLQLLVDYDQSLNEEAPQQH